MRCSSFSFSAYFSASAALLAVCAATPHARAQTIPLDPRAGRIPNRNANSDAVSSGYDAEASDLNIETSSPSSLPLSRLIDGGDYPLTLRLKDLNPAWRRVQIGATEAANHSNLYYTRGQTAMVGDQKFLVAYRRPVESAAPDAPPSLSKPSPTAPIVLSLLNLGTIGSLNDIRPFDLAAETGTTPNNASNSSQTSAASGNAAALAAIARTNLQQLAQALLLSNDDNEQVLPALDSAADLRSALLPYVKNEAAFVHPATGRPFLPNTTLSGKKVAHITNPSAMVALYEDAPSPDGTRLIALLDGRVKRIHEAEWAGVVRASKIVTPEELSLRLHQSAAADAANDTPPSAPKTTLAVPSPAAQTDDSQIEDEGKLNEAEKPLYDARLQRGTRPFAFRALDWRGQEVSPADYKGKVLLLDFWATWCPPCREEAPRVAAAFGKYHARGFDVLGISLDDAAARPKLAAFLKQNGMTWRQIHDGRRWESDLVKSYGVRGIPFSLLIGRDGLISAVDPRGDQLEPAIRTALQIK